MNTAAEKFYFVLALICAAGIIRPARGLMPDGKPQFWSSRSAGLDKVQLSQFSLLSLVCIYAGFAVIFAGAAFERSLYAFFGFGLLAVAFAFVAISRSRDVRRARQQRLPSWIS